MLCSSGKWPLWDTTHPILNNSPTVAWRNISNICQFQKVCKRISHYRISQSSYFCIIYALLCFNIPLSLYIIYKIGKHSARGFPIFSLEKILLQVRVLWCFWYLHLDQALWTYKMISILWSTVTSLMWSLPWAGPLPAHCFVLSLPPYSACFRIQQLCHCCSAPSSLLYCWRTVLVLGGLDRQGVRCKGPRCLCTCTAGSAAGVYIRAQHVAGEDVRQSEKSRWQLWCPLHLPAKTATVGLVRVTNIKHLCKTYL